MAEKGVATGASILRWLTALIAAVIVLMSFVQISGYSWPGIRIIETRYIVLVCGLPFGLIFLHFPRGKTVSPGSFLLDCALAATAWISIAILFAATHDSLAYGYEFGAPIQLALVALLLCLLVIEGARRAAGTSVAAVVLMAAIYPLFNDWFFPQAIRFDILGAASYYAFGIEAIFGVPARAFAFTIIGYLMFGVALQHTGAAEFFMKASISLLGRYRGGAGKVSVIASALLGSMSGSVVSNVLTTGAMTIPAMKRSGLKPSFAAGLEACASTGAVLMPPVMGATAFVMASFIGIPYRDVVIAAIIPAFLYFFSLFLQIDAFAARNNVQGIAKEQIPRLRDVMKEGWHYLAVFAVLIYFILTLPNEGLAPFYATAFLVLWTQLIQRKFWRVRTWIDFLEGIGKLFAEISGALLGIGILIGAIGMTGLAATITSQLAYLAGDSLILLLVLAAFASFLLGFGLPSTPAYIFVAIIVAPALVRHGIEPLAAHMFLYYWGMISFITPPVAIAAYAAASLAGISAMSAGFQAIRLGAIIYFVPFFFVLNPVLIMNGELLEILVALVTAGIGIWLIVGAVQAHLPGVGPASHASLGILSIAARLALMLAGLALVAPAGDSFALNVTQSQALLTAALLAVPVILLVRGKAAATKGECEQRSPA